MPELIHYLRARLLGPIGERPVGGDFFILAENDIDAGALAHDICTARNWTFDAYLALAQAIPRSSCEGSAEELRAFDEARRSGHSVLINDLLPGEEE